MAKQDFSKEDLKLLKEIREERAKSAKSGLKEVSSSAKVQEQLNKLAKESNDLSSQLLVKEEEINNVIKARAKAQKDLSDYTELYNDLIKGNVDALSEGNREIAKEILLGKQAALIATKKLDTLYDTLDTEKRATFEMQSALDIAQESLTLEKERLDVLEDMHEQIAKIAEKYEDSLEFVGDINKFINKMPGGALLSKVIGGDNLQKTITEKITKSIASATVAGKGLGKTMLGWGAALAGIMIVIKLVEWFDEMEGAAVTLAKEMDISKHAAVELEHAAHEMANEMDIMGIHTEDVTKAMSELFKATGINYGELAKSNSAAKELVETSALLISKFGLSGEEVSNLNNAALITGQSVSDIAATAELMGDSIVSGVDIMKDLGKVSKSVLMNFNKNPEALVKAVKKAKMLGTTLDQINKSGEALLDFESSIEAEMKANVMTGKNMNLNKARQLALEGKTAELQDEIVKQMGSVAEYDKLGPLQKKAMAEALGMQSDELNTMMMKQKELEKLGISAEELQAGLTGTEAQRAAIMKKVVDSKGEEGKKLLQAKILEDDRMKTSEKFAASMTAFTDALKGALLPVLEGMGKAIKPVADFFANNGSWLIPLIGGFAAIAVSMKAFNIAKTAVSGIKDTIGGIKGMLGKGGIADKLTPDAGGGGGDAGLSQAKEGKNKASQLLDGIKNIIESIKGVVQSAISFVKDVGKELITSVKDLLMGVVDLLKSVGKELITSVKDLLMGVVDLLKSVGGELLKVLGELMDSFGNILYKATDIIVNVGGKLAEGAVKILDIIMKGLGSAAATLPGIMASLGAAVVAFFTPMSALIPLAPAIVIFTAAMIGLGYAFKLLGEGIGAAAPGIEAFFNGMGTVIEKVGQAIALVIETITTSIIRLQDIDGVKLLESAAAIVALGVAIAGFGAGSAAGGVMSALGSFFDEDPVEKFNRFASIEASKLLVVAVAVATLGKSIASFGTAINIGQLDSVGGAIDRIGTSIEDFGAKMATGGVMSALGSFFDEDPVEKFNRFASIDAAKLLVVAGAIDALGNAFRNFSNVVKSIGDTSGITDTIDKILELSDTVSESPLEAAAGAIGTAVKDVFSKAFSFVSSILPSLDKPTAAPAPAAPGISAVKPTSTAAKPGAAAENSSNTEVVSLLKELIKKIDQPVQFNIGGKVIQEIDKVISVNRSYTSKENGYGS